MSHRLSNSLVNRIYSLYLFNHHKSFGRYRLADYLGVSKDQTRTIIESLVSSEYLEKSSRRQGHALTNLGQKFVQECQNFLIIPFVPVHFGSEFTVGTKDAVVCMEANEIDQLNTVIMRDEALLAGASGCTVFLQNSIKQVFLLNVVYPPLPDAPLRSRKVKTRIDRLTKGFTWSEAIIIVGSANSTDLAMRGALAAALLLFPDSLKDQLMSSKF
ncbi:MAG: DUF4443 domain-containing protein [Candidatus Hodarchaeales archaeon]|jgi:predicted transcriptional regulator